MVDVSDCSTERPHLSPHIIVDELSTPLVNHADGRRYTSKAKFRAATRAHGYEEVGSDPLPYDKDSDRQDPTLERDIRSALQELQSRK